MKPSLAVVVALPLSFACAIDDGTVSILGTDAATIDHLSGTGGHAGSMEPSGGAGSSGSDGSVDSSVTVLDASDGSAPIDEVDASDGSVVPPGDEAQMDGEARRDGGARRDGSATVDSGPQACVPNYQSSCGNCGGGHVLCQGGCSVADPDHLGMACGSCGGFVTCNGCSVATPGNYGTSCGTGTCGGTFTCTSTCSTDAQSCTVVGDARTPSSDVRRESGATVGTFDGEQAMQVSNNGSLMNVAVFTFDVSALPSTITPTITSATLRLHFTSNRPVTLNVYGHVSYIAGVAVPASTSYTSGDFDVTSEVKGWFTGGTLGPLRALSAELTHDLFAAVQVAATENADPSLRPQLLLNYPSTCLASVCRPF